MHFFYLPELDENQPVLPEEEARHALKVLRLKNGDEIKVTNGKGGVYCAVIHQISPKSCSLHLTSATREPFPAPVLHIAASPTKNSDRLEWFLEKATEIGISTFSPILCDHSERKIQKTDRLEKIVISALKQSQQGWKPAIEELAPIDQFISRKFQGQKFIAHCREGHKRPLKNSYSPGQDAVILIGPEGDFSEKEVELAIQAGFQPVSLGTNRLRTETAALVALHTLSLLND